MLYLTFNQDFSCFGVGTENGFFVMDTDPLSERFKRDFEDGGIGIIEMLYKCNIIALVGGGKNPKYPKNKVMIWDDHQNRCIGELSFRSEVKAVRLRRDRVVVVLEYKIYVYNFADLKLHDHIETISNPKGLCALCPNSSNSVLACPGLQKGHVRVELFDVKKTTLISAHEGALSCLSLNLDGTRLATASEKGTLIRIWDTANGELLQELRRGADRAEIYSISFNFNACWLAVSSDKGTIHVFSLVGPDADQNRPPTAPASGEVNPESDGAASNPKSSFSFMKGILPKYFSSEWSFAQFRVPEGKTITAFGPEPSTIIVISAGGSFYKCFFDPRKGGECIQKDYHNFLDSGSES
jgi:WD40 repeat protein